LKPKAKQVRRIKLKIANMPVLSAVLLLSSGCANVALDREKSDQVVTVRINPDVKYGEVAFNNSPGKAMGAAVGGAIGAGVAAGASVDEDDEMTRLIQSNSRLNEIAFNCFSEAIESNSAWSSKIDNETPDPDATFDITVYMYGFSTYNFLADGAEPAFGLLIKLIDRKDSELWSFARGIIDYPDGLPRYELDEYFEDMSRYDEAAKSLCTELIPKFINNLNAS